MFISSSNQAMYRWHQPPMFLLSRYGFVELGSLVNSKPWTSSLRIKGFSLLLFIFLLVFSCCRTLLQIEYIRYPLNPTTNQPVFAYISIVPALPKQLYMCSPLKLGPFTHTHTHSHTHTHQPTNYRNFASQPWEVAPRSSFFWELLSNYQPQEPKTGVWNSILDKFSEETHHFKKKLVSPWSFRKFAYQCPPSRKGVRLLQGDSSGVLWNSFTFSRISSWEGEFDPSSSTPPKKATSNHWLRTSPRCYWILQQAGGYTIHTLLAAAASG